MENIYKPSEFFCTELMNAEEHFKEFSTHVLKTNLGSSTLKTNIAHLLGDIKQKDFIDLQKTCRFTTLM